MPDLVKEIGSQSFMLIEESLAYLEQSLSFTLAQGLIIDHDLRGNPGSFSGLSEDKLLSENLSVKEIMINSLMLIALIKYKRFTALSNVTL
jgi:hypothetical protein